MKSKSLEKIRIVTGVELEKLTQKLRSTTSTINELNESIQMWKSHLEKVDEELLRLMQSGTNCGELQVMLAQKNSLKSSITNFENELNEVNKKFDEIAYKMNEEKNRQKFIDKKLLQNKKEKLAKKERKEDLDISELWNRT